MRLPALEHSQSRASGWTDPEGDATHVSGLRDLVGPDGFLGSGGTVPMRPGTWAARIGLDVIGRDADEFTLPAKKSGEPTLWS